jgi:hypothetical protein
MQSTNSLPLVANIGEVVGIFFNNILPPHPQTGRHPALKEEGGEIFVVLIYFEYKTCIEQFLLLRRKRRGNFKGSSLFNLKFKI